MRKLNVLVAGSTGYIGIQLVNILLNHRYVKIKYLCGNSSIGKNISVYDSKLKSKKLPLDFDDNANCRWLELLTYVHSDLNQSLDAASMANSIEIRTPFLDKRIPGFHSPVGSLYKVSQS